MKREACSAVVCRCGVAAGFYHCDVSSVCFWTRLKKMAASTGLCAFKLTSTATQSVCEAGVKLSSLPAYMASCSLKMFTQLLRNVSFSLMSPLDQAMVFKGAIYVMELMCWLT